MRKSLTGSRWARAFSLGPLSIGVLLLTSIAAGGAPPLHSDAAQRIAVALRSHVGPALLPSGRGHRNQATIVASGRGLLRGWNERELNSMPVPSQPEPPPPPADVAPAPSAEEVPNPPAADIVGQAPAGIAPAPPPPAPAPPAPAPPAAVGSGQLWFINQDRAAAGLAPLAPSGCLEAIARQQAAAMAAADQMFHGSGVTQSLGCGLGSRTGENVAYRSGGISDAAANSQFMNSAPHRANILGPFHYAAAAWACSASLCYIAVEFA